MTYTELEQKHLEIIKESLENAITHDFEISAHSKTSVEYAIEVLEELMKDRVYGGVMWRILQNKITDLKSLLK